MENRERPLTDRPVLITGASGRIGSLLRHRLSELGWLVRGCDLCAADGVIAADITDPGAMAEAARGCGAIIHLAGTPNAKPGWDAVNRLNIHGTRTVLAAARRENVAQVIYASSIHTIGALPAATPLGPDLPLAPSGVYGVSKLASEGLCRVYAAKSGVRTISVRICAFRPAPENARELRLWLGHDDTVHLFDRCLRDDTSGYGMIWGVSANDTLRIDDPTARRIGYAPVQNAADWRASLAEAGHDVTGHGPWPLMGGPVADDGTTDFHD